MLKSNYTSYAFNVASSGNICQAVTSIPNNLGSSGIYDSCEDVFDSGQYIIQTGAGVSAGNITIQLLTISSAANPVWVTATTPNSTTGAAFILIPTLAASTVYNGSLGVTGGVFFPCTGIRLVVTGLTGGSITVAQLILTKR